MRIPSIQNPAFNLFPLTPHSFQYPLGVYRLPEGYPSHSYLLTFHQKPKTAACILLTPSRFLLLRFIYILRSRTFFIYSLTSSSDQKRNDLIQNTSTMLGLFVFARGVIGMQNIGSDPSGTCVIFSSLSRSIFICLPLLAHSASIVKDNSFFCNLPYTKGVAKASTPQAAQNFSPVEAVILKPVFSREWGYAQLMPFPSLR